MRILAQAICLLLAGSLIAAPIPLPETAISLKRQALRAQFAQREVVDAYDRHGDKNPQWDDDAHAILEGYASWWAAPHLETPVDELLALAERASAAGCADPMVQYTRGCLLMEAGKPAEAAEVLRISTKKFPDSQYDVSFHCWAALRLAEATAKSGADKQARPDLRPARVLLPRVLAEANYQPEEQRLLYYQIDQAFIQAPPWEEVQENWRVISNAEPSPWLSHCLHAVYGLRDAWEFRTRLIGTQHLRRENIEKYTAIYQEVEKHCLAAWELDNEAPEAASLMLAARRLQGASLGELQEWLAHSVDADLDYMNPYTQLRFVMQNSRGLSHEVMMQQARVFLETQRFDSSVPFLTLQFIAPSIPRVDQDYPPLRAPGAYEDLVAMAEGYLAEPSRAWTHEWLRSFLVALAWRCERWDDGARRLAELPGDPDPGAFLRLGVDIDEGIGEILARTGDWASKVERTAVLAANDDHAGAEAIYTRIRDEADNPRVADYAAQQAHLLGRQARFRAGEAIDLLPTEDTRGWFSCYGSWSASKDRTLVGESDKSGMLLVCNEPFGDHYTLEGRVHFMRAHFAGSNAGVYFGEPGGEYRLTFPYRPPTTFRFYDDKNYATLDLRRDEQKVEVDVPNPVDFRIERRGDRVSTYLGDRLIHDSVELGLGLDAQRERLAIGGEYWYPDTVIGFTRLSIRLAEAPLETFKLDAK